MRHQRHRPERIAALVKETLAEALNGALKDPRLGFLTITHVEVSADATHATVHVSVMGPEDDKQKAMDGLESARGFLRSHLARVLRLRTTPDLRFVLDRGLEHAQRIDRLLAEIKQPPHSA